MAIARNPSVVIDCPDAVALAEFYAALLGWEVEPDDGWADIKSPDGQTLSFQQVADYRPPQWPTQEHPQQMHLDLMVDNLDSGQAVALELGASLSGHQPGTTFRVFLDPAGHPFCLCVN